jgi:acetyltransferase
MVKQRTGPDDCRSLQGAAALDALAHDITTRSGGRYHLRPIRPEDEDILIAMLKRSAREDIRLRFLVAIHDVDRALATRLARIDYDREMALAAIAEDGALGGVGRLAIEPDGATAEYAVMVRSDLKGTGLGYALLGEILAYARGRGIKRVWGEVLTHNTAMLTLAREFGFKRQQIADDPGVVRVTLDLA